ncbi:STAS domain-containing protein [Streptomyces bobili]|uniref:STAS domain-containing protein n=1 Tax=Streptomyces bobili TaxID=67280 RepID=UPI003660C3FE
MSGIHPRGLPCHTERTVGDITVMDLRGEIDILTAPLVSARVDALTADPHPDLVLDLRRVSFIDCAGLSVLCRARNRTTARFGRLRLVTDSARFLRTLRHAGLSGAFDVHAQLPEAATDEPEARVVSTAAD